MAPGASMDRSTLKLSEENPVFYFFQHLHFGERHLVRTQAAYY